MALLTLAQFCPAKARANVYAVWQMIKWSY